MMNLRSFGPAIVLASLGMALIGSPAEAGGKKQSKPKKEPAKAYLSSPFDPKISRWTQEPITTGNDIQLYITGEEFFPLRLQMIRDAKETIDFQSYLWCDDESGLAVAHELAEAHKRGVRVRLIMDWTNVMDHDEAYSIMEGARRDVGNDEAYGVIEGARRDENDKGIELLKYNSAFWGIGNYNKRLHEKVMIVDGTSVLMGGANMCNEYLLDTPEMPLWQDLEFLIKGPAVARMQAQYDDDWNWMAREDFRARLNAKNLDRIYTIYHEPTPVHTQTAHDSKAIVQHQQPYRRPGEGQRFAEMFSDLVRTAKHSLVLYVPYIAPNPLFKQAVVEAAKRGVDVKIFTNSEGTNDMAFILVNAALTHYGHFLQAGARIFEREKSTLHAKAMLIDGEVLSVGSHNFTHRSFSENGEINVMTDDPRAIARFKARMEQDMATFNEVDIPEFMSRVDGTTEQGGLVIGKWLERLF